MAMWGFELKSILLENIENNCLWIIIMIMKKNSQKNCS